MSVRATFAKPLSDWSLLTALGICILAAAVRIAPLSESLWLDELHTAWCAVGPLNEVAQRAAIGNQGPLFFWLEWLMVGLGGPSELAVRLLSFVSGSLLPLAVFLLARRWRLASAGLVAAALVAVDPLSIFYATEARPYALVQLLVVIHMGMAAEMPRVPTVRWRLAWIGFAVAMFYLHYTAALVLLAEVLFLAVLRFLQIGWSLFPPEARGADVDPDEVAERRRQGIPTFSQLFVDLTIVGLVCLLQFGTLQHVFAHRANWAAFVARTPYWDSLDWLLLPMWYWGMLLVSGILGMQVEVKIGTHLSRWPRGETLCFLVALWLAIPLGVAWLTTYFDLARLFYPRYLVALVPGAALLAGFCVHSLPWHWARAVGGILTVVCALWHGGVAQRIVHEHRAIDARGEDWRGCVAWLNERLPDGGFPVLVYSGLIEADELRQPHDALLEDYCLSPVTSLYPLDIDRGDLFPLPLTEPERLDQVAEMLVVHRGGAWLVVRGNPKFSQSIAKRIAGHLAATGAADTSAMWHVGRTQTFGKVQLLLLTSIVANFHEAKDPSVAAP